MVETYLIELFWKGEKRVKTRKREREREKEKERELHPVSTY